MMKVKICGLFRDEDILYVNEACPDYVGFVFFEKSHRNVDLKRAVYLKSLLNGGIKTVGVFVDEPFGSIVNYAESGVFDVIQLHGSEDNTYINALKEKMGIEVWKAFKLRSEQDSAAANDSAADMLVLDNGKGTGYTFDWSLLESIDRSYFLAGGIDTENIDSAAALHPYGIDCSSGAETNKVKDRDKIMDIVAKCRKYN